MENQIWVQTANMGSCWCGSCWCAVFADGTIKYKGEYDWQKSERFLPSFRDGFENSSSRPYKSNLKEITYKKALEMLARGVELANIYQ